jgi:two-component sensor histidine kinase
MTLPPEPGRQDSALRENSVVILAPYGKDAALIANLLAGADVEVKSVSGMDAFAQTLADCGVGLLTTEALSPESLLELQATLHRQPAWSDIPLILLTSTIDAATYALLAGTLGNVTIVQRPLEAASLLTIVQTALRARNKQRQVRDLLKSGERRQAEIEALNARLRRSTMETHHRVKNNLQMIYAMIEMQSQQYKSQQAIPLDEYMQLKAHVHTLAIVHDLLTKNIRDDEDAQRVSVKSVLERLLPMLQQTAWQQQVHYTVGEGYLASKQCVALSLILNELVVNALKHGRKTASVRFRTEGQEAILEVADDGNGFAAGFSPLSAANVGLELVESLVHTDLKGASRYETCLEGGGQVTITFPLPPAEPEIASGATSASHHIGRSASPIDSQPVPD